MCVCIDSFFSVNLYASTSPYTTLSPIRSLEMPVDGIHLGCVVGALQLSQGPSAAAAWLRGSFDGGTRPTLPAVAVGGEVEGREEVTSGDGSKPSYFLTFDCCIRSDGDGCSSET